MLIRTLALSLCLSLCSFSETEKREYDSLDPMIEGRLADLKAEAQEGKSPAAKQLYMRYAAEGLHPQASAWAARYIEMLTAQAEAGDTKSMLLLATDYIQGNNMVQPSRQKALEWLQKAADAKEASAAYIMGELYTREQDLTQSKRAYERAYELYCQEAEHGLDVNANALYWKAYMLQNGIGTEPQPTEAIKLLEQAAEKQNVWALMQLFATYTKGIGVSKNEAQAISYARKLADLTQDALMAYTVASAYLQGKILSKDIAIGRHYLDMAVAGNNPDAIATKAIILDEQGKMEDALPLYRQAASMGQEDATLRLGMHLLKGDQIEKDEPAGLSLLQRASERFGMARAVYELALYYDSIGETEMANHWYVVASDRGVTETMAKRGLLHLSVGSGVDWSPTECYRWWSQGAAAGDSTCALYRNLFIFGFIPLVLIFCFLGPIFLVRYLNKRAAKKNAQ